MANNKKGSGREAVTVTIDKLLISKMRQDRMGKISEDINSALIFWYENKDYLKELVVENQKLKDAIPMVACRTCPQHFSITIGSCPNCHGHEVIL